MDPELTPLHERLTGDWDRFLAGLDERSEVRPFILASWERCRVAGVDPGHTPLHRVPDEELERRLAASADLLEIARPHLDWLAPLVAVPYVLYLTDADGIVLHAVGNDPALQADAGLSPGHDWSEARMGTNGAGTALVTGHPVAVVGAEHFARGFAGCTCTAAPILDAAGAPVGALDLTTPELPGVPARLALVTYAARAIGTEQAGRRSSDERYRTLFETMAQGVVYQDAGGEITSANPAAQRILGLTLDQMQGRTSTDPRWKAVREDGSAFPGEEHPAMVALRTGRRVQHVVMGVFNPAVGDYRWILLDATPLVRPGENRPYQVYTTFHDVTERKRSEQALRASEERFRFLADLIPQLVWSTRPDGYHDYYNRRWFEYTGLTYEDTKGPGWNDVLHPDDRDRAWDRWRRSLETGEPYSIEYRFRRHDGEYRWFLGLALPLRGEGGEIERWFGSCTDIQEQKDAERALRESEVERAALLESAQGARAEAEAANRLKSEFLATVSHELRTPINAVMGYVDLLELGIAEPLLPDQLGYVTRIRNSSRHLLALINDVLDLAKVEAGEMHVLREPVELRAAVARSLEITEGLVAGQRLRVEAGTGCEADLRAWGDEDRVRQILVNLLSNATKFTDPGGRIGVRCRLEAHRPAGVRSSHEGPWVGIEVEDTGIGIAEDVQEMIFAPFSQADSGRTRRWGGTGLGLSISRTLARLMAGDLTVRSAPGEGSCFTLWLPAVEG
jgi:PAS domain S-box-containing protein